MDEWLNNAMDWEIGVRETSPELRFFHSGEMQVRKCSEHVDGTTITWRGHPVLGPMFQVVTDWSKDDKGFYHGRFSYSGYASEAPVEEIHFPIVRSEFDTDTAFLTGWDLGFMLKGEKYFSPGSKFAWGYNSMQFSALLNSQRPSIYFDHRDPDWNAKSLSFAISADGRQFAYHGVHYVANGDGTNDAYAIPYENVCGCFYGGWFEAGQIYKNWGCRQRWNIERQTPNPLRNIGLWVWNRGAAQDVVPPVKRLREDCAVPVALSWYWWHRNPYDSDYPDYWPPREGEIEFRRAVAALNDADIYSQVYLNGVCWDMDGATWHDGGDESVVIKNDGTPFSVAYNRYNHHRLGHMCGEAPKFHDRLSEVVGKLHETGLRGTISRHGRRVSLPPVAIRRTIMLAGGGNHIPAGYRRLLERLRTENPGIVLTTECANEVHMDRLDGAIVCTSICPERLEFDGDFVPLFPSIYHGKMALFGSYAFPDGIPPWDPLWPKADRWQNEKEWYRLYPDQFYIEFARSAVWGVQPMVCNLKADLIDRPEFREIYDFILTTAGFYYANRDYLFDGTMLSPDGFICADQEVSFLRRMIFTKENECQVINKRQPVILHSCWRNPQGKCALFAVNYTAKKQPWEYRGLAGIMPPHSWMKKEITDGKN